MRGIEANVMYSKKGELERASATWAGVIGRDDLEFQQGMPKTFKKDLD